MNVIKQTTNIFFKRIAIGLSIMALLVIYYPNVASAAQITARKVTIGSSAPSATTTYAFQLYRTIGHGYPISRLRGLYDSERRLYASSWFFRQHVKPDRSTN